MPARAQIRTLAGPWSSSFPQEAGGKSFPNGPELPLTTPGTLERCRLAHVRSHPLDGERL